MLNPPLPQGFRAAVLRGSFKSCLWLGARKPGCELGVCFSLTGAGVCFLRPCPCVCLSMHVCGILSGLYLRGMSQIKSYILDDRNAV